jgi:phosphoenolpyruvate---glycerone phosphotransferase subunit DhaM
VAHHRHHISNERRLNQGLVSLVLVSHSRLLAEGLRDMVEQVAGERVRVAAAGGTADGRLGTNAEAVLNAIRACLTVDAGGVLVLLDLGSAWLSVEMALEELSVTERARVCVSEAPLVEGAVLAAVQASLGALLPEVAAAAASAASMSKAPGGVPNA